MAVFWFTGSQLPSSLPLPPQKYHDLETKTEWDIDFQNIIATFPSSDEIWEL